MSDFIVNLVRRGAGLAPIVRSRPMAPLDEISSAGNGEPQSAAPQSGASMPVMPETTPPSVLPASPAAESRTSAMALAMAAAPAAVAQRAAVGAPIGPAPVPAAPSVAVAQPAVPQRPAVIGVPDRPPGQAEVASAREAEAATMSMRVVETPPRPRETIVETRRQLVPMPVVLAAAQLPQPSSDEAVPMAIPIAVAATVETPTIAALRIEHMSETGRVALVSPILAPESTTNDDRPTARDAAGERQPAPSARTLEVVSPFVAERRASSQSNGLPAPGPVVARAEPHDHRTDPTPQTVTLVAASPKAAQVSDRVVELPAAVEVVRRRESVEVASTRARTPSPPAQETPAPDRLVEVRIGAVEIHSASPLEPPQQTALAPARVERPSTGFEEFVRLRTYAPWQW